MRLGLGIGLGRWVGWQVGRQVGRQVGKYVVTWKLSKLGQICLSRANRVHASGQTQSSKSGQTGLSRANSVNFRSDNLALGRDFLQMLCFFQHFSTMDNASIKYMQLSKSEHERQDEPQ